MSPWKEILTKERKKGEKWADVMRRKFEKVLTDLVDVHAEIMRRAQSEAEYRAKISAGTRKGLERARRRGVKLGGARSRKSKIDDKTLKQLRRRGFSQMKIAEWFGCSQALVSRKLKKLEEKKRGSLQAR